MDSFKMPPDRYDCFRRLADELRARGLHSEADQISIALASGSTASECLDLLGRAIRDIRAMYKAAAIAVAAFIDPCLVEIRRAWPYLV
jgi:Asp/Glu/hydantoin racemase